jgi:hypothetical protein
VRRCGPTQQRLWLGPGRYSCGCDWRRHAFAYTYSYAASQSNTYAERNTHTNTYGDGQRLAYSYAQGDTKVSADSAPAADPLTLIPSDR